MKITSLIAVCSLTAVCFLTSTTNAQVFEKGTKALNVGFGLGGYNYGYVGLSGISPSLNASLDFGVAEIGPGILGIGGYFGYRTLRSVNSFGGSYNYDYRYTNLAFGMRGNYHWNTWHDVDKLDVYAGVMLGYDIGSFTDKTVYGPNSGIITNTVTGVSGFGYSMYAGGRYMFSEKVGGYAEVGYGYTAVNIGLTVLF